MSNPMTFSEVLKKDQRIVDSRLDQFEQIGILELFDRMLKLIDDLTSEVEEHTANLTFPRSPTNSYQNVVDWNDRLRLHMLGVVVGQFIFAVSHVCRAQPSEAFGHMRRAIEAAGIAYTSKLEPDIGRVYGAGDEDKFWTRIKRHKILPNDDPMTSELNKMMKRASSKLHSNMRSVAGSVEEDFEFKGSRVEISFSFLINELNPSIEAIWEVCSYLLRAMYHVARLFEVSFSLPEASWHHRLESYRADIDEFDSRVKDHLSQLPSS
jgi:hypothetical protein